jgi:hypothetical protein
MYGIQEGLPLDERKQPLRKGFTRSKRSREQKNRIHSAPKVNEDLSEFSLRKKYRDSKRAADADLLIIRHDFFSGEMEPLM